MALNRVKISRAADKLVRQGRLDAAIGEYQRLLDDSPDDLATLNKVGDLHCRAGQPRRALTCFLRIAEHYRDRGFAQKAIAMYKKIAKLDPSNPEVIEQLVALYQDQGLTREALRNLREAARLAADEGDMERALELECRAMELAPGDWRGQESLARRLRDAGKTERAVAAFVRAAEGFSAQEAIDEAVECCREALALAPLEPDPARALCRLLMEAGQAERAVTELEALLESDPAVAHLRVLLGEALLENGATARAREVLEEAESSAEAQGSVDYHLARVTLDLAEEQHDSALSAVVTVVPLLLENARLSTARELLCRVLEKASATDEALRVLLDVSRRESAVSPDQTSGWQTLKRVLPGSSMESALEEVNARLSGDAPPPAADSSAGVDADPGDLPAVAPEDELNVDEPVDEEFVAEHLTEADVFIKYKLLPKAVAHLKRVADRYPCTVVAHQRLVELYLELGERDEAVHHSVALARAHQKREAPDDARAALQEALRYNPDNPTIKAMRTALKQGQPLPPYRPTMRAVSAPPPVVDGKADAPAREQPVVEEATPSRPEAPAAAAAPVVAEDTADEAAPVQTADPVGEEVVDLLLEEGEVEVDTATDAAPEDSAEPANVEPPQEAPVAAAPPAPPELPQEQPVAQAAPPVPEATEPDGGFFDLAGAIEADLAADEEAERAPVVDDSQAQEDPSGGIRRAIQDQVSDDDHQTHYQLGIAFKEMGMLDEAIGEFQQASRDPDTFASCCSMLGLCFREKGMPQIAEKWYRRGLENMASSNGSDERLGLIYDLADLHLSVGDIPQAREGLTEVYANNANYREVARLLREVEESATATGPAESTP